MFNIKGPQIDDPSSKVEWVITKVIKMPTMIMIMINVRLRNIRTKLPISTQLVCFKGAVFMIFNLYLINLKKKNKENGKTRAIQGLRRSVIQSSS